MINVTTLATKDDFGPKRDYDFPPVDYSENMSMDDRQRSILTDLIFQKCDDPDERER